MADTTVTATASPNLDKSLDDIISARPRGGGRRGSTRGSGPRRHITGDTRGSGSLSRSPRPPPSVAPVATGNKILISNLPPDVTERDVSELFSSTVGPVRECQINYDPHGRSKGSASVIFVKSGDATQAFSQYNNRLIDGKRTLRIEIVVDPARAPPPPTLAQRVGDSRPPRDGDVRMSDGGSGRRDDRGPRRGGRGSGRGGRRTGNERPKKTAEDLDAEMADYIASNADDA